MKNCPNCGGTVLVRLSSQNRVHCNDCSKWSGWELKDGQPPLISNNRDTRSAKKGKTQWSS